ncbi:uncharacterized protein LACBIDRAFT_318364 [Laccaria bicolor S238N-H82]|uniref:Predicted protein n=1 Tax=Laccaria bicolor (strain S238N-H82 / ATCC MYA-4686) TaxID=486041 RepID=B0D6K6_LACBS|nr:uncharacterized protein LACBIDRAFT_318364 [Laccaria bicolor S238N-H82]EDR10202.1 predicted protein [Laccaria bicolor S238N-H82]|eukprot:XP_001879587.1 predicted protein [Laccaria bicolor S238N-H82]
MNHLTLLVALATVFTACEALGTDMMVPGIVMRQTNTSTAGGFASRAPKCSTGQVDCGGGIAQEICCPSGQFCFHNSDGTCCPTNTDCTTQLFLNPQCADPSWVLCTDYQPNIPGYVPNDPGYWCCPTGTQCLVSSQAGFVCRAPVTGDVPGSTILSGQAPTQASTATTYPTLGATSAGGSNGAGSTKASSPSASSIVQSSAVKSLSFVSVPVSLGIFAAQALFALCFV